MTNSSAGLVASRLQVPAQLMCTAVLQIVSIEVSKQSDTQLKDTIKKTLNQQFFQTQMENYVQKVVHVFFVITSKGNR